MYDWPEEREQVDALWLRLREALRAAGLVAPDTLTRDRDLHAIWTDPDLVLGQTCGLPFCLGLHTQTQLIGAIDNGLSNTPAGHYYSVIVARADDTREPGALLGERVALNEPNSQSGWGALAGWAASQNLTLSGRFRVTGAHRTSAQDVAQNRADIAAIDAVSWRLTLRHDGETAAALRVVAETKPTPSPPLITAKRFDAAQVASAVEAALGPSSVIRHSQAAYFSVPRFAYAGETQR